jgi:sigma-B regulation protein RsbU (phosphoserine phosphatase)
LSHRSIADSDCGDIIGGMAGEPAVTNARLVLSGPERTGVVDCLHEMSIGRDETCDLVLPDQRRRVSRRHARLEQMPDGAWHIFDNGSRNGVLVNGVAVSEQPLQHNDVLKVGPYRLRFVSDALDLEENCDLMQSHTTVAPNDRRSFDAVAYGSVDGPDSLNQRQLRVLRRLIEELTPLTSPAAVAVASCQLLCQELGAGASMLLANRRGSVEPDPRVVEQFLTPEFDASSVDGPGVSQSLIGQVLMHRKPMLANASASAPGGIEVSQVRWCDTETVACAIADDADERQLLVYVVFATEQVPSDTAELIGLLARQIGLALRASRLQEMARHQALIERELTTARSIQSGLVPQPEQVFGPLQCHVRYDPCREVGGDYADVWQLDDGRIACIIADVCGKGLGAALVMTQLHAAVRVSFGSQPDLARVIDVVNRTICDHTPSNMFVTLTALLIEPESRRMEMVVAGHPPPILAKPDGSVDVLSPKPGMPVGVAAAPYECHTYELPEGSSLWLYTDGIHESMSPTNGILGINGVADWVRSSGHDRTLTGAERLSRLVKHCADWREGGAAQDDQTIVLLDL